MKTLTCWQAIRVPKGKMGSMMELTLEGQVPDDTFVDG